MNSSLLNKLILGSSTKANTQPKTVTPIKKEEKQDVWVMVKLGNPKYTSLNSDNKKCRLPQTLTETSYASNLRCHQTNRINFVENFERITIIESTNATVYWFGTTTKLQVGKTYTKTTNAIKIVATGDKPNKVVWKAEKLVK